MSQNDVPYLMTENWVNQWVSQWTIYRVLPVELDGGISGELMIWWEN